MGTGRSPKADVVRGTTKAQQPATGRQKIGYHSVAAATTLVFTMQYLGHGMFSISDYVRSLLPSATHPISLPPRSALVARAHVLSHSSGRDHTSRSVLQIHLSKLYSCVLDVNLCSVLYFVAVVFLSFFLIQTYGTIV
jgi:hypothetical protein